MRIIIASRIFSPEPAAASFMLEAIAVSFRDAGHSVTVLTTKTPRSMVGDEIPGIKVRRAPVLRDKSGYVRGYLPYLSFDIPLAFRLLFSRADLYVVEPPPTTGAVVRCVAWLQRRPYVYRAADIWSDAAQMVTKSPFVIGLLRWVEKFAIGGAAQAFAISDQLVARLRELGTATPATVIGSGVDTAVFNYTPSRSNDSPYFIYAGTYSEWHGASILVDAFAQFAAMRPEYRLIFVGNGADRAALEGKCRDLGLRSIQFLEPVVGAELNKMFSGATASLASLKPGEGYDYAFTTKVYSSLATGCPVIFAGVGPTVAFIEEARLTQPVGMAVGYNIEELSEALSMMAHRTPSPEARRRLSEWARSQYSIRACADEVVRTTVGLARN